MNMLKYNFTKNLLFKNTNILKFNLSLSLNKLSYNSFCTNKNNEPQILIVNENLDNNTNNNNNNLNFKFENLFNKIQESQSKNRDLSQSNKEIKVYGNNIKLNKSIEEFNDHSIHNEKELTISNQFNSKSYFSDRCRIYLKAGDGGNGKIIFDKGPMMDQCKLIFIIF